MRVRQPGLSSSTSIFALACGAFWFQGADSLDGGLELSRVWRLEIQSGAPVVVQNNLGHDGLPPFPLESIVLLECHRPESGRGPDEVLHAVLHISKSGLPANELSYVPAQLVSHGSFGDEPVVTFGSSWAMPNELGRDILQTTRAVPSEVRGFEASPRSGVGVLLEQFSAQLVRLDSNGVMLGVPHHVYEVAYARHADVGALLALHLDKGEDHFSGHEQSQIIVFDYSGRILFESPLSTTGHPYQQLYVNPNGNWLMVTQRGPDYSTIATDYVTLFDVNTGEGVLLEGMSGGLRFCSLDGTRMALVQTGWGKVYYYDLSAPRAPRQIWTWKHEPLVANAAVNADGSLIALIAGSGSANIDDKLLVLDGQGNIVAQEEKSRETSQGVMFVDDYLFLGTQGTMVPAYYWRRATNTINMYYTGALR